LYALGGVGHQFLAWPFRGADAAAEVGKRLVRKADVKGADLAAGWLVDDPALGPDWALPVVPSMTTAPVRMVWAILLFFIVLILVVFVWCFGQSSPVRWKFLRRQLNRLALRSGWIR